MTNTTYTNPIDAIRESIERRKLTAAIISGVLSRSGHPTSVDPDKLIVKPKGVHEKTANQGALSNRICDLMYPHEPAGDFFHYTGPQAFEGIIGGGLLRLTHLSKRMSPAEGEIRTSAEQHGWEGYLDDTSGPAYAETLAKDLFYTSFTRTQAPNPVQMWTNFGEGGRGARLRFRIEVNHARGHRGELRAIQYQANGKTLLNLINDDLDAAGLPHFLPWTASKIGAFNLLDDLHHESEIRLLFKHHQGVPDERQNDGPVQFWAVAIDQENNIASIKLTGIEAGPQADLDRIRKVTQASAFARVDPQRTA